MIKDNNKGIYSISYNVLNLPEKMDIVSPVAEAINSYLYTARGEKIESNYLWNPSYSTSPVIGSKAADSKKTTSSKNVQYAKNKVYENGTLKRILLDDGYYEGGKYYYFFRDHLGSIRCVSSRSLDKKRFHYYPFGMPYPDQERDEPQPVYRYNGKELDYMHGLDLYDYSARYYDFTVGSFTTIDPLAEKYYSISPYAYCNNNPVRYIDPTGMDWYEDEDGTYQYDPNLTAGNRHEILKKGQIYIGVTSQIKDKKGNVIENYREDGSIMYSSEASGYKRIWNNTQKTGNEEMGVITDKGVLVLPSYKNSESESTPENYGYSWTNGNIQDADGNSFNTLGTVHTHPNLNGDMTASMEDISYFSKKAPNKPFFVLMANQKISSYMSYPENAYGGLILPNYNGVTPTLNGIAFGKYPLIRTLKQNRK